MKGIYLCRALFGMMVVLVNIALANAASFQNGSFANPGIASAFINLNALSTFITSWEVFDPDIDYVARKKE